MGDTIAGVHRTWLIADLGAARPDPQPGRVWEAPQETQRPARKNLELQASPKDFTRKILSFEVSEDPSTPVVFGPFHTVTLSGHPDITIPWTDPYLLMEWRAFLRDKGVAIFEDPAGGKRSYRFQSRLLLEEEKNGEELKFRCFDPSGNLEKEIRFRIPSKPEITVSPPSDPLKPYRVSVYGHPLEVRADWPADFSAERRMNLLKSLGETLQEIPESMIAPLLKGVGAEKPLTIFLSDAEKAKQTSWMGPKEALFGKYRPTRNTLWSHLEAGSDRGHFFHEVGGHAYDDFAVPENNPSGIVLETNRSALKDYFAWKLSRLFTPKELAAYNEWAQQVQKWRGSPTRDPKEKERLKSALIPFREKALKSFVSTYAVEGGYGIRGELASPNEDFAEVMRVFFESLNGRQDWGLYRTKEPLLTLVGLDYLFHEHKVAKIGNIGREEVYSKKAFRTVLGIDVDSIKKEKDFRPGFTFSVAGGVQISSPAPGEGESAVGPSLTTRAGYRGRHWGGGASLAYALHATQPLDAGLWGHGYLDLTPLNSGALRGVNLFGGPLVGVRTSLSGDQSAAPWAGAGVGLGLFGGALSLVGEGKLGASPFGDWKSFTLGLQVDPTLIDRFWRMEQDRASNAQILQP